jgi:hypothetical protein
MAGPIRRNRSPGKRARNPGKEGHPIIEHTHEALFSETAPDLFPKEQVAGTHKSTTGRALGNTQYEGLFQQPPIVESTATHADLDEFEPQPETSEAPRQSRRRFNS